MYLIVFWVTYRSAICLQVWRHCARAGKYKYFRSGYTWKEKNNLVFRRTPAKTWRPGFVFQEENERHLPAKRSDGAKVLLHRHETTVNNRVAWKAEITNPPPQKKKNYTWKKLKNAEDFSFYKAFLFPQSWERVAAHHALWFKSIWRIVDKRLWHRVLILPTWAERAAPVLIKWPVRQLCRGRGKNDAQDWGNFPLDHNGKKGQRGRAGSHMTRRTKLEHTVSTACTWQ